MSDQLPLFQLNHPDPPDDILDPLALLGNGATRMQSATTCLISPDEKMATWLIVLNR